MPIPHLSLPNLRHLATRVTNTYGDVQAAARLGRDLPAYLRHPTPRAEAECRIRYLLATREQRFLRLVQRAIYARPDSPYRALLAAAGCEFGDMQALVSRDGLEGALMTLAQRGVYLTHSERRHPPGAGGEGARCVPRGCDAGRRQ